jgi:penicillin V acylase-like amidase (Ntn superfamily)
MAQNFWYSELSSAGPALQLATRPTAGCTTAVGRNGDETVHARNVDFWGMGFWQKYATIMAIDPRDALGNKDGYRYIQVSDIGELFAGTTGINEQGLSITTHLRISRDVAPLYGKSTLSPLSLLTRTGFSPAHREVSVYRVVETILRRADRVETALELVAPLQTVGAWTFIISDPQGETAVIDIDNPALCSGNGCPDR